MLIVNPLTGREEDISAVLNCLAAQENCDGEPYDQMVLAAEYIKKLEHTVVALMETATGYQYDRADTLIRSGK